VGSLAAAYSGSTEQGSKRGRRKTNTTGTGKVVFKPLSGAGSNPPAMQVDSLQNTMINYLD
ncbi:hypothetical protein ACOVMA_005110, partial [Escherichia coli]